MTARRGHSRLHLDTRPVHGLSGFFVSLRGSSGYFHVVHVRYQTMPLPGDRTVDDCHLASYVFLALPIWVHNTVVFLFFVFFFLGGGVV